MINILHFIGVIYKFVILVLAGKVMYMAGRNYPKLIVNTMYPVTVFRVPRSSYIHFVYNGLLLFYRLT